MNEVSWQYIALENEERMQRDYEDEEQNDSLLISGAL
jgi:hypothetical protein